MTLSSYPASSNTLNLKSQTTSRTSTHRSHHGKRDSMVSVSSDFSTSTAKSHKDYLDSLVAPTHEMVEHISEAQEQKEEEVMKKRLDERDGKGELDEGERERAAGLIQRNYRGHRERRMLEGMSLDPSTRWVEAVKEARYRHLTQPRPRSSGEGMSRTSIDNDAVGAASFDGARYESNAKLNWKKVGLITRRAGGDEDSDEKSEDDGNTPEEEREARRKRRMEEKAERQKAAKMMDLQYFLEMVDLKHRYGSNLRTYHAEWKKADTKENFFYWLDYGEGRFLDCQGCPRERLDREQVRYLSKEERLDYLVKIDKEGRLCWAKNGVRIDTTAEYRDSIHGIVPDTDDTPAYGPAEAEVATGLQDGHIHHHRSNSSSSSSSTSSDSGQEASARADKYATPDFDQSKWMKNVIHVSAATIFNKLLRSSVKKNTWIFVADTSFRLYVGIKQSGAFQHSSFLHGSRISAAGLIKIKNGRLAKLSPLSGHYRPPVSNFRAFVHSLKDAGVDMSHVSISRSYAVLVGLEAYVKSRRRGKKILRKIIHHKDKIIPPKEMAEREEAEREKSESAAREQRFLELKQKAEEEDKEAERARINSRLMDKLHIRSKNPLEEGRIEKSSGRDEAG